MKRGEIRPEDIVSKSEYELLKSENLSIENVTILKQKAALHLSPNLFKTAHELLLNESKQSPVSTGCSGLDRVLNGGLKRGHLTEINGESGCGKTQIALQIAAHAWNCGAVYLCTEDSFPSKRLQDLFQYVNTIPGGSDYTKCGDKIFISQLIEVEDLVDSIRNKLPKLLEIHKDISVVIIDSVAAPFRGNLQYSCNKTRAQHFKEIGINLIKYAKTFNVAVLCINQVAANLNSDELNNTVPCLGLAWSNMVTTRISVTKTNRLCCMNDLNLNRLLVHCDRSKPNMMHMRNLMLNIRRLKVVFSPNLSNTSVDYVITPMGVISVDYSM